MPEPLLERVIAVYCRTLEETGDPGILAELGLNDPALIESSALGYCDGRLPKMLPSKGPVFNELRELGILDESRNERFAGCLTIPLLTSDGDPTGLVGIRGDGGEETIPSNCTTRLWNAPAAARHDDLLVTRSLPDALAVRAAGLDNVIAILDSRIPEEDLSAMTTLGVKKLCFLAAAPEKALRNRLKEFQLTLKRLPGSTTPHACLLQHGPERLAELIGSTKAESLHDSTQEARPFPSAQPSPDGFILQRGPRRYAVLGLQKGPRRLRATVRVEHGGRLYVETLDLYSARARKALARDLGLLFEAPPAVVNADVSALVRTAEEWQPSETRGTGDRELGCTMTEEERREAEAFGRSPDLLERIVADYETEGLVGEDANKLLCYIAAVSRKMAEPLSMLILSSSGAGKSALQDATLAFCPPEEVVKLTTLSGRALFYKGRQSLKHKILAIEEGAGAETAAYAIRSLISAGELVIESAVRDSGSGGLTTVVNRVEGPTAIFFTTTDPDTDPETRSRFFVTSVDESPEQTRRILAFQRNRRTLEGLAADSAQETVLRRHHNFQRLLRPVAVVNPYAGRLRFGDDRLQGRRDQPKYLNLINAIAFLRQMRKPVQRLHPERDDADLEYVEEDIDDIRAANKLANEVLGHSLDELSRPAFLLLMLIEEMVLKRAEVLREDGVSPAEARPQILFSRREVREFTGWVNSRVHRNLRELADMEYVLPESGRGSHGFRYQLAYEGQGKGGERFLLGLTDPEELEQQIP